MIEQEQGLQRQGHHQGHPVEARSNPHSGRPRPGNRVQRIERKHEVYASAHSSVKRDGICAVLLAIVAGSTGCAPQITQTQGFHLVGVTYRLTPSSIAGPVDASGAIDADFAFLQSVGFDTIVVPHVIDEPLRKSLLSSAGAHNLRVVLPDERVLRYVEDGELAEAGPATTFVFASASPLNDLLARLAPADGTPMVVNYLGEAVDAETAGRMRALADELQKQGRTAHLLATTPAGVDEASQIRRHVNLLARGGPLSSHGGEGDIALLDVSVDGGGADNDAADAGSPDDVHQAMSDDDDNDVAGSDHEEDARLDTEQAIADQASAGKRIERAIAMLPEQFYEAISTGLTGGLIIDGLPIETGRWEETLTRPIKRYVQLGDPLRSVVAKARRWGPKLRALSPRRIYRAGQQESLVETVLFVRGNRRYVLLRNVGEAEYARETADIPAMLADREAERAVEVPVRDTLGRKVVFTTRNVLQIPADLSPGDAALWEVF